MKRLSNPVEKKSRLITFHLALMSFFCYYVAACSSVTPHDNFQLIFGQSVGKSIDADARITNAYTDRLLSTTELPNGHFENKYLWYGACRYFFEIDSQTRIIVSWRFEGTDADCRVNR